jgi:hypothetical protein
VHLVRFIAVDPHGVDFGIVGINLRGKSRNTKAAYLIVKGFDCRKRKQAVMPKLELQDRDVPRKAAERAGALGQDMHVQGLTLPCNALIGASAYPGPIGERRD